MTSDRQLVLEAVCWGDLPADATVVDDDNQRRDLTAALVAARVDGLVVGAVVLRDYELTKAGEKLLADMWGPDRIPPWAGGVYDCPEHGEYVAGPGEWWTCPDCPRGVAS